MDEKKESFLKLVEVSKSLKALFVEDEKEIRNTHSVIFEKIFKQVDTAENGLEGLKLFKQNNYDLVITDLNMPKMSGIEMIKEIKQLNPYQRILVISAHNDLDNLHNAISSGIDGFIEKPLQVDQLVSRLQQICDKIIHHKKNVYHFETIENELNEKELNLKQTSNLLNQFQQAIDTTTIVSKSDIRGNITYVNEALCKLSGYSSDELIGKPHSVLRHPEMPSSTFEDLWKTIKAKKTWKGIIKNLAKNGETYYVKSTIIPLIDEDNNILEYISIRFDITELIHAKEQALASMKVKSEFLANMSHEIRTPMNGILGFTELLKRTELSDKQQEYINTISNSTTVLMDIVNDILDLSKLESGKFELDYVNFNPLELFVETVNIFRAKASEKDIELKIEIDHHVPECINSDSLRIRQIISNLINNAIKFTPKNGTVKFYIRTEHEYEEHFRFRIGVSDTGIGISEERQEEIFKAFSQAETSTTRQFGGTGLGLTISSKLAKLLGSVLQVKSETGVGSDFYLLLDTKKCAYSDTNNNQLLDQFPSGTEFFIVGDEHVGNTILNPLQDYLNLLHIKTKVLPSAVLSKTATSTHGAFYFITEDIPDNLIKEILNTDNKVIFVCDKPDPTWKIHQYCIVDDFPSNSSKLYNELISLAYNATPHTKDMQKNIQITGKVLVAEDNEVNQVLIKELLEHLGIEYTIVENGKLAIRQLKKENFDLVLMDINMPVMGGTEALQKIRDFDSTTPIVALTANAMEGDRDRFLLLGFNGYLMKPLQFDELNKVLNNHLHNIDTNNTDETTHVDNNNTTDEAARILNLDDIREQLPLKDKSLFKMLILFQESFDEQIYDLQAGIDMDSMEKVELASHSLKGSASNLRLTSIENLMREVEHSARKNEPYDYYTALHKLKNMQKQFNQELMEILDE